MDNWLNYSGDNSVILFFRSYWWRSLRPRCWIEIT